MGMKEAVTRFATGLFGEKFAAKGDITVIKKNAALYTEQAAMALLMFAQEALDADEILKKLGKSRKDLRVLEYDTKISGALDLRYESLVAARLRLDVGDSSEVVRDFVLSELYKKNSAGGQTVLQALLDSSWNARLYGYSGAEIVYQEPAERGDGKIGIRRVVLHPLETYKPQTDGSWKLFDGQDWIPAETVFKHQLAVHRPTKDNPAGQALLSRLYWPWFFKRNGWKFWMQALEKYGTPTVIAKTMATDPARRRELADALMDSVQDSVLVVGKDDDISTTTPNANTGEFKALDQAIADEISIIVLGGTLTVQAGDKGARSLGEVHSGNLDKKTDSDIRLAIPLIQSVVDALTALNFPSIASPEVILERVKDIDLDQVEKDRQLYNTGLRFTPEYYAEQHGYNPDHITVAESLPGQPQAQWRANMNHSEILAAGGQFTPDQEQIEKLIAAIVSESPDPIPAEAVLKALRASATHDEFIERLAGLIGDDWTNQELAARAYYMADVFGFTEGGKRG